MTSDVTHTTTNAIFDTPAGRIIGFHSGGVTRATGIPFAQASRFKAAVAVPTSTTDINAQRPSPACPQPPSALLDEIFPGTTAGIPFSEDCLRLSVTTPAHDHAGKRMPVMVFVHGGSYVNGVGDARRNDPSRLVEEQHVVAINIQYRLGIFGFLGDSRYPDDRPANLGLLDLIEGLRWIRTNIASFGGDPNNVTLFGQSAGGDAIVHLMISDGTRGLFHRAIIQSAPLGIPRDKVAVTEALVGEIRHFDQDTPVEDILAKYGELAERARSFGTLVGAMPMGPQYGFRPLPPECDVDAAWQSAASSTDVLIGSTSREGAFLTSELTKMVPMMDRIKGIPLIEKLVHRLFFSWVQHYSYDRGITRFIRNHKKGKGKVARYSFSWGAPSNPYKGAHCVDLPFLLGSVDDWRDSPLLAGADWDDVSAKGRFLRQIWAEFARSGAISQITVPGFFRVHR